MVMHELLTAGEDVLVFYNDKASFNFFIDVQRKFRAASAPANRTATAAGGGGSLNTRLQAGLFFLCTKI